MWRIRWWGGLRPVLQTGRSSNPGGDSRGFQVVADPCSRIAHWQAGTPHWARHMYHLGKESETVEARVAVDGRGVTMSGKGRGTRQGRRKGLESDSAHISHTPGEPHLAHLGNFARCQTNTSFVHISHVLHLVQVLTYIACSNKQNQNCQI